MAYNPFSYFFNKTTIKNLFSYIHAYGLRSLLYKIPDYLEFNRKYNLGISCKKTSAEILTNQRSYTFSRSPKISIIVPVYKTPEKFLRQMIDSVINQSYVNWELCIADGSADPSASYISDIVSKYQQNYSNIQYTLLSENLGISGNTNAALTLATGDYIGLLDHDDLLTPDALFEIVNIINKNPAVDVIYSDEDKVDISLKNFYSPYFKPDFNLDLLRSSNYITHFFVVKKELADKIGGFSSECNGSQDYDFILKSCEQAKSIYHIPKVLYHWRIHPSSVAGDPESKSYAYDAAVRALQNHLKRCHESGLVRKDALFGYYRIRYQLEGYPKVSIFLKDCSPDLKEQIQRKTDYSNYTFVDSLDRISGEYIVILYKVIKIETSDWLEQLISNCSRPHIGIVSGKIYYRKKRVLEFGLTYTPNGQLHSPFYNINTGYCFQAAVQHNCSMVGSYCLATKTTLFRQYYPANGKDSLTHNIWKFCFSVTQNGYLISLLPGVPIYCHIRHPKYPVLKYLIGHNDPYYNPNFSEEKMFRLK